MKRLVCEMCNGMDLVKSGGLFVCQTCGCKYSVEEAKKMMIEGTVDVKGSVVVDRTSEAENVLKNADGMFCDGNYKEAFALYSQALTINPDNAHAIIYRSISSAWQSTVLKCKIMEIDGAAERALKLAHKEEGDAQTYFEFVANAIEEIIPCITAVFNMYMEYYNKMMAFSGTSITLNIINAESNAEVERTLEYGVKECCTVSKNIIAYTLNDVENFSEAPPNYWDCLATLLENANEYRENADMNIDRGIDRMLKRVAKLKYWTDHAEVKDALEIEKKEKAKRIEVMREQADEIYKQRSSKIDELQKVREQKLPEEVEVEQLNDVICNLEKEKKNCGIFNGKEKKILQDKIDQENVKLERLRNVAEQARKSHVEYINNQILMAENIGKDIIDEYENLRARVNEIDNELTKER